MKVDFNFVYVQKGDKIHKLNRANLKLEKNLELLKDLEISEIFDILFQGVSRPFNTSEVLKAKLTIDHKNFIYNNQQIWIDKETRNSLFNLLNSLEPQAEFDLIVEDKIVKLPVSKVKKFLTALEQYAAACKVQTLKHINNIKDIKNVEDLLKYDYTLGYPNQINLNDFI